ncbi:YdcF family protein [Elioraea sp.]|uniref:YdcF family protein n=1 Tax=Elioraea sp. TaxID=2185103 RepID=UPI003F6FC615
MTERPVPRRFLRRLAAAAGVVLLALLAGFVVFLARLPAESRAAPPDGTGIVVLTGGAGRVAEGLRLLDRDPSARLLVSGVHHAAALAELDRPEGIDAAALAPRITLGRRATSTRGNAEEAAAWARAHGLSTLVVVTAGYHMPRALLMLRRELPQARLIAHPVTPAPFRRDRWWLSPGVLRLAAGEYVKLLAALAGLAPADRGMS